MKKMKHAHYTKVFIFVLSAFMLTGAAMSAFAQGAVVYEQKKLMLHDEEGDVYLSQLFWDTCETGIKKCILFKNVPPQESQLRLPRFIKENPILSGLKQRKADNSRAVATFNTEKTFHNLRQIILDEEAKGMEMTPGQIHDWTIKPTASISKIVVALATASSSRFLYVGQEEKLIEWITARPDNSVTIEALFLHSYKLNKGNLYLTILTIENVLSDATFEADRENTLVNQKLVDLYKASPNKFGDWYHFFGTMLAGYTGEPAHLIVKLYSIYRKISRGEQAEKATLAADKAGADIGAQLRKFMLADSSIAKARLQAALRSQKKKSKKPAAAKSYVSPQDKVYVAHQIEPELY